MYVYSSFRKSSSVKSTHALFYIYARAKFNFNSRHFSFSTNLSMKTIAVVLRFPTFSVEGSSIDTRTFKTATKDLSGKPFTVDPDISYVDLRDAIMNASRTRGLLIDDLHGKLFTTSSSSNSMD